MYFWWIPPGSLDASWVSFWCLDMEVPCQVNRFTQPLSPEEWFQVSTLGQIWMELNHQERHIHYSSCIDHIFNHIGVHIFIIPSSIFNINQTTSSGKEAVNRKKTGGFFHHCSTTNIVQSFEPQPWFALSVVQQVVLDVGRHGMFLQDIGSLGSSIYLTVKQVFLMVFVDPSWFHHFPFKKWKQSKMLMSFHPLLRSSQVLTFFLASLWGHWYAWLWQFPGNSFRKPIGIEQREGWAIGHCLCSARCPRCHMGEWYLTWKHVNCLTDLIVGKCVAKLCKGFLSLFQLFHTCCFIVRRAEGQCRGLWT